MLYRTRKCFPHTPIFIQNNVTKLIESSKVAVGYILWQPSLCRFSFSSTSSSVRPAKHGQPSQPFRCYRRPSMENRDGPLKISAIAIRPCSGLPIAMDVHVNQGRPSQHLCHRRLSMLIRDGTLNIIAVRPCEVQAAIAVRPCEDSP